MTTIFQSILDTRSFTVINYKCEDAIEHPDTPESDRAALQRILESNSLDERWALAHEHLGQHDKAAEIREWMKGAAQRKRSNWQAAQQILGSAL